MRNQCRTHCFHKEHRYFLNSIEQASLCNLETLNCDFQSLFFHGICWLFKFTMTKSIGSRSPMSKDAVPDEPYDPQVEVMGDIKGKVEQVKLLDLDLTNQVLFHQMSIDIFWSIAPNELGGM
jgi:hypothetical protein